MKSGKESVVNKKDNVFLKTATIKGQTVQVRYIIQDGIVKVGDAWIKK